MADGAELLWATGYNALAIPAAAGVFYSLGVLLSPAVGAILMSLSTVIVAIKARFLRVKRDGRGGRINRPLLITFQPSLPGDGRFQHRHRSRMWGRRKNRTAHQRS